MGKKAKGKHRLDKFYYLAKEQGFRSRASFKLIQLNRKYDFFSGARACMDLCAAPGGWLQVAVKYMPMSSTIVGVDLAPIKPIRGCTTFVDDITTQSCRAQLKRCTPEGVKYDVVMHDGAPNVGGNYAAEAYTQAALTLDSLRLATEFLREGGWFVTKVFRSTEYHALLYSMQQLFQKVESNKPQASRGTSAEIFVVCQGYLAPAKIDPRLLDPRHLFAEYDGPKQAIDVLSHQKQKRNRSGYEDGVTTLYKECPAEAFIHSDKPTELLGQYHVFLIDASNKKGVVPPKDGFMDLDNHPATTDEIRALCLDLGVLGRADFKLLLKWRLAIRKSAGIDKGKRKAPLRGKGDAADDSDASDEEESDKEEGDKTEEDKLMEEMEELQQSMDARARRDKKKKAKKLKAKERMRTALGLQGKDAEGASGHDMDLFSLARIKSKGGLDAVQSAAAPGLNAGHDSDDDMENHERRSGPRGKYDDSSESSDGEIDDAGNDARLEAELDHLWREYKERHTKKGAKFKPHESNGRDKRTALGAGELESDDEDDASAGSDEDDEATERALARSRAKAEADAAPSNPLVVDLEGGAKKTGGGKLDWFANDLFNTAGPAVGSVKQARSEAKAAAKRKVQEEEEDSDASGFDDDDDYFAAGEGDDSGDEADSESEEEEAPPRSKKAKAAGAQKKGAIKPVGPGAKAAKSAEDDSDSDEDDYDEIRTAAAAKKKREEAKEAKSAAKAAAKELAIKKSKKKGAKPYDDTYDDDTDSSEDDGGAGLQGNDPTGVKSSRARRGADNAGFIEVGPEHEAGSSSEDSDDEDVDDISDGEKAEILAIGKNMIRKKDRDRMIDDAYNKYARDDDEDLPEWFLEDERKFMRPPPVYDQKDLDEANERLAAVDTKSIKKVAEAKFRKKKKAEKKMAQARQRASTIMEQDDVPDVSKVREIEKIYAKARTAARGKRREIKHVVARKFHKGNAGGPSVDKRMLSDRRGQARALRAKGGVKKGGRGGGRGGSRGGGGGRGKKGFK